MRNIQSTLFNEVKQHFFPKRDAKIATEEVPHDFHPQPFPLGWKLLWIKLGFIVLVLLALYGLFEPSIAQL